MKAKRDNNKLKSGRKRSVLKFLPFGFSNSSWRLGSQITYLVAINLFVMVASVSLVTSYIISQSLTNDFVRNGKNIAVVLAEQASIPVLVGSPEGARQAINIVKSFASVSYVAIYENDGNLLAEIGGESNWIGVNANWKFDIRKTLKETDTKDYWQFISPVFSDSAEPELEDQEAIRKQQNVIGLVRVRIDKSQLYSVRNNIILGNIVVLLAVAFVLVLSLKGLTTMLTRPLEEFVDTMRAGALGEKANLRIDLSGSKETSQLSDSFNRMMSVLEDREIELATARDQALAAARLKSEFAANVSHEIRTPLNGIVGTLNLLSDSNLNNEQREYIGLAESASDALMTMINDILDFSRLSLDQTTVAQTAFDLRALMEELIALHSKSREAKTLDLLSYYDPQLPDIVESDANKIRQLLNNLISNAVKFTEDGLIEVNAEKEIDAEGRVWIRISVRDTGIGMREDELRKIFLPYAQSDGTMSRKYSGTGLGLAISEKLAELLFGDIGVNSELGVGSEFFVRIPFAYRPNQQRYVFQSSDTLKLRVYLYSDENKIVRAVKNLCDLENIQIYSFSDIEQLQHATLKDYDKDIESLLLFYPSLKFDTTTFWEQVESVTEKSSSKCLFVSRLAHMQRNQDNFEKIAVYPPLRSVVFSKALNRLLKRVESEIFFGGVTKVSRQLHGKRVLLVEDNVINQKVAQAMLKKTGCEVYIAENGLDALAIIKQRQFDVIFMDCQMPKMNGYDATREIRSLGNGYISIPIIAMTANAGPQDQIHCFEVGMNDFISKPVKLNDLHTLLVKWTLSDEHVDASV